MVFPSEIQTGVSSMKQSSQSVPREDINSMFAQLSYQRSTLLLLPGNNCTGA